MDHCQSGRNDRPLFCGKPITCTKNDTLGILKILPYWKTYKHLPRTDQIEWYYRTNDIKYLQDYPFDLIMGEMSSAYEQFTQAVRTCVMYQEFDIYPQKKNTWMKNSGYWKVPVRQMPWRC